MESMFKLSPAFKDYLWGGTQLRDRYHMDCDFDIIAEAWLLSAHADGNSIIATGENKGKTFVEYLNEKEGSKEFPILIKFIDAKGNLSVQVHPDDEYAHRVENENGKNEMWYVVDSEPGAGLYVGFNRDVSREEVEKRVKDNTLMDVLNFFPTKAGDAFFIPAGTVHAIGSGNLICEIQQSSNSTYRLYDYDRRDKNGNPRELHLDKALDVLNYGKYKFADYGFANDDGGRVLASCHYFESVLYNIEDEAIITLKDDSFTSFVCIEGEGTLRLKDDELPIEAGESVFIPACAGEIKITGKLALVKSYI